MCGRQLVFFFEFQREQRFVDARGALRRMGVLVTTVQTLVPHAAVAVAVTRQLRERLRDLARGAIRVTSQPGEFFRSERWPKTRTARRGFVVRRHWLRR